MSYKCPVCGVEDETAYLRCYRTNCTDGRDRYGRTELTMPPAGYPYEDKPGLIPLLVGAVIGLVTGILGTLAIWVLS